jgi:exodeoxyribonuclease X
VNALIFDTETTDKKEGEIIEAAWLRLAPVEDLAGSTDRICIDVAEEFCRRYQPTKPMTFGAIAVHHILPSELDDCEPCSTFALPADCTYVIGHSVDFDWEAAGSPKHIKRIDTHAIAQWQWPDATGYSQSALIYMLEGATPATRLLLKNAHSALADVRINLLLLSYILKLKPEIQTWSELWEYSERCRIPRTCPMKKYEGVLLADLDDGFIDWCLRQDWLDPYYRKGLELVMEERYPRTPISAPSEVEADDDIPW